MKALLLAGLLLAAFAAPTASAWTGSSNPSVPRPFCLKSRISPSLVRVCVYHRHVKAIYGWPGETLVLFR